MKLALLTLGLVIVSLGGVVAQESLPGAYTDQETGISFPPSLGGLEYGGVRRYEEPALGYSLRYQNTKRLKADIYVYDASEIGIPDGYDNVLVKRQAASVGTQLKMMVERGYYENLVPCESGVEPVAGTFRFVWNRYEFFTKDKDPAMNTTRLSECFVTGFHGKFIKIRLTYLKSEAEEGRRAARDFAQGLASLLESTHKPSAATN